MNSASKKSCKNNELNLLVSRESSPFKVLFPECFAISLIANIEKSHSSTRGM